MCCRTPGRPAVVLRKHLIVDIREKGLNPLWYIVRCTTGLGFEIVRSSQDLAVIFLHNFDIHTTTFSIWSC